MNIRPDLLARLYALHSYFFAQWHQVPLYRYPMPMSMPQPTADVINPFEYMEQEDSGIIGSSGSDDSTGSSSASGSGSFSTTDDDNYYAYPDPIPTNFADNNSSSSNLSKIIAKARGQQKLINLAPKEETTDSGDDGDSGGGTMTGLRVEKPTAIPKLKAF